MSFWTECHGKMWVVGTPEQLYQTELEFGEELKWDDPLDIWHDAEENPKKYMPYGSEGSLRLIKTRKMKRLPDTEFHKNLYKKCYIFEGNLRDRVFEDTVLHWFSDLIFSINTDQLCGQVVEAKMDCYCLRLTTFTYNITEDEELEE